MTKRDDFTDWVRDALVANGGRGSIVDVARHVWTHHEHELKRSGDLFFTWQYDVRWAATTLRKQGVIVDASVSPKGIWELAKP